MNWFFQRLRCEEGEFLGILADSGDASGSAPVEVHVSEFECQYFQFVFAEKAAVVHNVVGGRSDGSLTNMLRNQKESDKDHQIKRKSINKKSRFRHFRKNFKTEKWKMENIFFSIFRKIKKKISPFSGKLKTGKTES